MNVQFAPCQIPVARNTMNLLITVLALPLRLPPSGMYRYSLNHVDSEMCHLLQNSLMDVEM